MATTEQQGLEKAAPRTPDIIRTGEEFQGALARWRDQRCNILSPFTAISGVAPGYGIYASRDTISTDKEAGEVYDGLPFLKKDEYALAKKGLRKLAECAGISTQVFRLDDRRIPYFWEVKAVAFYRGVDGSIITREASKEWDLRDGSAQMKGWTDNQILEARKHGLRNCEARAINAAIRECGCGLKQKYSKTELERPFVVVRVSYVADMSDPEVKRMVTAAALGGMSSLYAQQNQHQPQPLPPSIDIDAEEARPMKFAGQGQSEPAPVKPPPPTDEEQPL